MGHPVRTSGQDVFDLDIDAAWSLLATRGWLAGRTDRVRTLLRSIATLRPCAEGDKVYHSGDESDGVYALVAGGFDISIPRHDCEEFVAHRAEIGFWIGELGVFSGARRLVSVTAATRCQFAFLPRGKLLSLVEAHPDIMFDFYALTNREFATALTLLGNLAVPGAQNRVALRLLMLADALPTGKEWIEVSQALLAEQTAVSQQSLRRALHALANLGLVETGYNKVRIIDRDGLALHSGYSQPEIV